MEKPLSFFDWELQLRNATRSKSSQILTKGGPPLKDHFKRLLLSFSKRETLIKSGGMLSSQFKFIELNIDSGTIKCIIQNQPSKECIIEINKKMQYIHHKCKEFRFLNKFNKHFCSHLIRLFLILSEIDLKHTNELLKHISCFDYDFFPKIKCKKSSKLF
ncbi:MAG: hypothetical protein ACFFBH_10215 [Promethearchaeota archaeon]